MKTMNPITRIYTGNVKKLAYTHPDQKVPSNEKGSCPSLVKTFEVFQDACNYMMFAIAGMAYRGEYNHTNHIPYAFALQVESIWSQPIKNNPYGDTLGRSVCRSLGLNETKTGFAEAVDHLFQDSPASEYLPYAASFLYDKINKGEGVIRQEGRNLLPKLCFSSSKANYDFSAKSMEAKRGQIRLEEVLNGESLNPDDLRSIASEMHLGWSGVKLGESVREIKNARDHLKECLVELKQFLDDGKFGIKQKELMQNYPNMVNLLETNISQIGDIDLDSLRIPNNNKADSRLKNAALWFQFFPSLESASLLKVVLKKVDQKAISSPYAYDTLPDDPLLLCRGKRGYVFPSFTSLPSWSSVESDSSRAKEFNIAAFKEALKTLNQFKVKTDERHQKIAYLTPIIAYMEKGEGSKPKIKSEDDEESDNANALVILANDPRYELLQRLIKEMSSDDLDIRDYGITKRTLGAYADIKKEWLKLLKKDPNVSEDELKKVIKEKRGKKNSIGDVNLLEKLCTVEFRSIWCQDQVGSKDIFSLYLKLNEYKNELEKAQYPIRVTAAHAQVSPRQLIWSDLKSEKVDKTIASNNANIFVICKNIKGQYVFCDAEIEFQVPRSERDMLSECLKNGGSWLPPMLKPLSEEKDHENVTVTKIAMGMVIKKNRQGDIYCSLNFPVTLDISAFSSALKISETWAWQLHGTKDKNISLKWPSLVKEKQNGSNIPISWWDNPEIQKSGFDVLSCDLGVRFSFAYGLIHAGIDAKHPTRTSRILGQTGQSLWQAYVFKEGTNRLDGEGSSQYVKGEWQKESFARGRAADGLDTKQALKILTKMTSRWYSSDKESLPLKNYSEQNKLLLERFRNTSSRLRRFLFWSYKLVSENPVIKKSCYEKIVKELSSSYIGESVVYKDLKELLNISESGTSVPFSDEISRILAEKIKDKCLELQKVLPLCLEMIADRCLTQREYRWKWEPLSHLAFDMEDRQFIPHILTYTDRALEEKAKVKIKGQGGLSHDRIEIITGLRRCAQSLNRLVNQAPMLEPLGGKSFRDYSIPDVCPLIADKLEHIKEQRVNKIAHDIAALALGVRLKPSKDGKNERFKQRDIMHGEYEKIPGRKPVSMVILEDLSRYLMKVDRSRRENTTLMQWTHRAIFAKVKELLEPVGIPLLEVKASYSSKFDCMTSALGCRVQEIQCSPGKKKLAWLLDLLNKEIEASSNVSEPDDEYKKWFVNLYETLLCSSIEMPLIIPDNRDAGELFLACTKNAENVPSVRNADINAAINIAWRGIGAPGAFNMTHQVRLIKEKEKKSGETKVILRMDNVREKALFSKQSCLSPEITLKDGFANLFIDVAGIAKQPYIILNKSDGDYPSSFNCSFAYSADIMSQRKKLIWFSCMLMNKKRLEKKCLDSQLTSEQQHRLQNLLSNFPSSLKCISDDDIPL